MTEKLEKLYGEYIIPLNMVTRLMSFARELYDYMNAQLEQSIKENEN